MFSKLSLCVLLFVIYSVKTVKAYEDFCDEPRQEMYCSCEFKYRETIVACHINTNLGSTHELWSEMSKVENVVILKFLPRSPNALTELPLNSLKALTYLETLIVQQSNFSELQSYAISGLKVLRELEMNDCEITALQPHSISNMPNLKKLSMSGNQLQEVLVDTFTGLLELEKLFMERNSISRIEGCAFCDLQNLRELDLFQNEITDLTEYMFRGLRYLKRMDLSLNKIGLLNDKIFHSLPKLEELDLSGNLIHHVASRAFQGLESLQRLLLYSNKIKTLPDAVFKSLPKLRSVDLHKNELDTFQVQILERMDKVKDQFFSLDIRENPLVCDCRLSWVKSYMKINRSRQFTDSLRELKCKTEEENATVFMLKMKCDEPAAEKQPKSIITTSRSVVAQPVDLVPYEIQKRTNKTIMSTDDEAVSDDAIVSQDGESAEEKTEDIVSSGPNGSRAITADSYLIAFMTLLTIFLVRKRKGTYFI